MYSLHMIEITVFSIELSVALYHLLEHMYAYALLCSVLNSCRSHQRVLSKSEYIRFHQSALLYVTNAKNTPISKNLPCANSFSNVCKQSHSVRGQTFFVSFGPPKSPTVVSRHFFGFLRVGEFTAQDSSPPSAADPRIIGIRDISRALGNPPQYFRMHLRVSKTDPLVKGFPFIWAPQAHTTICPVAAILSFLVVRPIHLSGPLLRFPDGSILTRTLLVASVRMALAASCIDTSRYAGHSFWI